MSSNFWVEKSSCSCDWPVSTDSTLSTRGGTVSEITKNVFRREPSECSFKFANFLPLFGNKVQRTFNVQHLPRSPSADSDNEDTRLKMLLRFIIEIITKYPLNNDSKYKYNIKSICRIMMYPQNNGRNSSVGQRLIALTVSCLRRKRLSCHIHLLQPYFFLISLFDFLLTEVQVERVKF